jgi:DNA-binding XRE family transcriptional regulator
MEEKPSTEWPTLAELSRELEQLAARLEAIVAESLSPTPETVRPNPAPRAFAPGGRARLTAALRRRLAEARRTGGLTQAGLGRRIGRHPTFVSNYERGERRLEVAEFVEIARALGLDPAAVVAEVAGQ